MVMRRARSPIFGLQSEVTDMEQAATVLGKNAISQLLVSQGVKQAFQRVKDKGFDVDEFWLHSLAVAVTARILALSFQDNPAQPSKGAPIPLDEVKEPLKLLGLENRMLLPAQTKPFTAGLLHDIGKVAMAVSLPDLYPQIVEALQSSAWQIPTRQAESSVGGQLDHCAVGSLLAQNWGLDKALIAVTSHHHDPPESDGLCVLICLADFIGGAAHSFPADAAFPATELLGKGGNAGDDLKAIGAFLPEGLLEHLNIDPGRLAKAGGMLVPTIEKVVVEIQKEGAIKT